MAGHDVEVIAPIYVSLEINMDVCVAPGYLASHVEQALLRFSATRRCRTAPRHVPSGQLHVRTNGVSQSDLRGRAEHAWRRVGHVTHFARQDDHSTNAVFNGATSSGKLVMDRLQIARLDNDPNYPEHGVLNFACREAH